MPYGTARPSGSSERVLKEVVNVHPNRLPSPSGPGVLELPDPLLLLRVHADHRAAQSSERLDLGSKAEKLAIAFGMSRVRLFLFPMAPQRILPLSQQPSDRGTTDPMARLGQGRAQRTKAAPGPFRRLRRRSGGLSLHLGIQNAPYRGVFFSTEGRPPPVKRTPSGGRPSKERATSSRPLAMVFSSKPVINERSVSPPRPIRSDSTAASHRRCCSSNRLISRLRRS
jgi:hypothetical protein